MPAKSRSTKPSKKTARKISKKKAKKVSKTAARKVAKKVAKKVTKKGAKKVSKKVAKKVAKKASGRPQKTRQKAVTTSAESRNKMIEKAAYYRAERRNFQDGDPVADWLSSEKEVDELLDRN